MGISHCYSVRLNLMWGGRSAGTAFFAFTLMAHRAWPPRASLHVGPRASAVFQPGRPEARSSGRRRRYTVNGKHLDTDGSKYAWPQENSPHGGLGGEARLRNDHTRAVIR